MKYIANPVEVDALVIKDVGLADGGGGVWLTLETTDMDGVSDNGFLADKGMLARYFPVPGDYLVRQQDGYFYLNPKEVFERKYRPA